MASANQANQAYQAAVPRRLNNRRGIAKGLKDRFRSSRPNGRSWSTRRSAQTQSHMRLAEQAGDRVQVKARQERWNVNCAS